MVIFEFLLCIAKKYVTSIPGMKIYKMMILESLICIANVQHTVVILHIIPGLHIPNMVVLEFRVYRKQHSVHIYSIVIVEPQLRITILHCDTRIQSVQNHNMVLLQNVRGMHKYNIVKLERL
jgi:hypothetical protein